MVNSLSFQEVLEPPLSYRKRTAKSPLHQSATRDRAESRLEAVNPLIAGNATIVKAGIDGVRCLFSEEFRFALTKEAEKT